jgi:tetratricopeptide (TPR) repeat protein
MSIERIDAPLLSRALIHHIIPPMKSVRVSAIVLALAAVLVLAACVTSQSGKQIATDYYNIGNAFFDLGQYDKAVTYYQDALRVDPGMVKADYNLALTLIRMKRMDEAITILKRLLTGDQKNTTLMAALGWAYHQQGKDQEALNQYEAILALSPADQNALYNSGIILWKMKKKEAALDRFRKVLAIAPDDTDSLFAAGSILLSLDQASDAADMLSRYVEKKPGDIDAWYLIAASAERLQKYSRALEAYDKIIAIDPKQANAWFGEARLLLTVVEDPQKGLDALDKALTHGFSDKEAVKALLASPQLLEKSKVEAALKEHNLLPPAERPAATESGPSAGQGTAQPAQPPAAPPYSRQ